MIKNIVFDFGNVLVSFDPIYMTRQYVSDEADVALVSEVLFDRLYWDKLDAGAISDEEVVRYSCERLPQRLHGAVADIYYNWIYNIPEIEGMRELVREVKESGKGLYLLSNINIQFSENRAKVDKLKLFDGIGLSSEIKHVKPEPIIYNTLLERNNLNPRDCIFIDDRQINVDGGEAVGIKGYLFDGETEKLRDYINNANDMAYKIN